MRVTAVTKVPMTKKDMRTVVQFALDSAPGMASGIVSLKASTVDVQ